MQKISRNAIKEATKGMWNNTRVVYGINVARVCWFTDNQYMIIENDETFKQVSERTFIPIQGFRTQGDMVEALYRIVSK